MAGGWRGVLAAGRLGVGPLAVAGFFLPWAHGPGPLAGSEFTGYGLVGYAGRLQALELSLTAGAALWLARLLVLAVAVAGTWQIMLAPRHRTHPIYGLSGWYLVALAGVTLGIGLSRTGPGVPPAGLFLLGLAGGLFALAELAARVGSGVEPR